MRTLLPLAMALILLTVLARVVSASAASDFAGRIESVPYTPYILGTLVILLIAVLMALVMLRRAKH